MFLLVIIIIIILLLLYNCYNDYKLSNDPMVHDIKKVLLMIDPRASQLSFYKNDKSFSINKRKIYLCVEDENGNYYSKNTLIYVGLHELAHCLNTFDVGHTPMFHKIFEELLHKARVMGYYNQNLKIPENYCMYKK
jgi:hypothetical protein